jgi:L-ascorbate metabolism protein UlaG (beta-lactamase superfamily)
MDLQFYGANCVSFTRKNVRIVIDDNLADLGAKSITKEDDIVLFTGAHGDVKSRLTIDGPGEYEVSDISIVGIAARSHLDEVGSISSTMYKLVSNDFNVLVTGHIYPEINESLLELIGTVDVLMIPVGGNGYTLDPIGALKVIKDIEPKLVIPTHYNDKSLRYPVPQIDLETALKEMSMEPRERVSKLRVKPTELTDITQLVVLEKS